MAPVIETGFRHVVRVILRSDDSSGIQSGAAGRLLDLHAQAVTLAGPDPVPLARRLVKMGVDEQDFFDVDVVAYAGVLDERGRATYRREIEKRLAKDPDSFRARRGLERLAVLERDPDAIVSLIGGDLAGPHAYLSVVEALLDAGLDDDALTIATDGIGSRLVPHQTVQLYDAAVRLLRERGDHQRILTLRREQLSRIPNRTSYTSLRRAAKEMSRWPEERLGALAMLLEHNQRDWLLTLLDEGETDLAWDAASRMRLDASLVLTLLRARAKTRPADVFDGYVELVDDVLTTAGQQNYRQAIGHLAELRRAAQAAERTDEYADYIAQLLEKHRRRPTLVEMLERTPRA